MASSNTLQIEVEADVLLPSRGAPKRVLDALRRQIRQHGSAPAGSRSADERGLLALLETKQGLHRLPQAMLPSITDACHRYGVEFSVVDRRRMVACSGLRMQERLSSDETATVRRMLLRDSGVLLATDPGARLRVAAALIERRQQRTLLAAATEAEMVRWVADLRRVFGLSRLHVNTLDHSSADTWLAVCTYDELVRLPDAVLQNDFGMTVCDGLSTVEPMSAMRVVRTMASRYLLGLAATPTRPDGLHSPLYLALGGVTQRLAGAETADKALTLEVRNSATAFAFDYQGRQQYQALLAALAKDPARTNQVAADIASAATQGHYCLVISERKDHLEELARALPKSVSHSLLTSSLKLAARQRALEQFEKGAARVLLASSQIALDGINSPRFDRLFLAFPFAYAQKLANVIEWLLSAGPGQSDAVLYDYDDSGVEPLHRAFLKRSAFLQKLRKAAVAESRPREQLKLPL